MASEQSSAGAPTTPQRLAPQLRVPMQHRCHLRLADVGHVFVSLEWFSLPQRTSLWFACMRSEVGNEPSDAYLIDPKTQALRVHEERPLGGLPAAKR